MLVFIDKIASSETIRNIVDANETVKMACLIPNLPKCNLRFHKLKKCLSIIEQTILKYGEFTLSFIFVAQKCFGA